MKSLYAKQIFRECTLEYPCRWCAKYKECTTQCASYNSYHYFYQRIGKQPATELMIKLPMCKSKSEALELLNQYNKY